MSGNESSGIYTISRKHKGPFHVQGQRLFILHWQDTPFVISDYCNHRGGPLSLGTCNKERGTLVCPWHGNHNRVKPLLENALPVVRVGDSVSFLLVRNKE
jgi:nitrite reductase/ring-hydroxylating ferredoxin subunit